MSPHARLRTADSFYAALKMPRRQKEAKPRIRTQEDQPITGWFSMYRAYQAAKEAQLTAAEALGQTIIYSVNILNGGNGGKSR